MDEMITQGHLTKGGEFEYTIIIQDQMFADFAHAWDLNRISPPEMEAIAELAEDAEVPQTEETA